MNQKCRYLAKNVNFGQYIGHIHFLGGEGVKLLIPTYQGTSKTSLSYWKKWPVSLEGHHELSGKSNENKSFKPNQIALSIYIMVDLCFSLDQWEIKKHLLWGKCFSIPHWPRSHSTNTRLQHNEKLSKTYSGDTHLDQAKLELLLLTIHSVPGRQGRKYAILTPKFLYLEPKVNSLFWNCDQHRPILIQYHLVLQSIAPFSPRTIMFIADFFLSGIGVYPSPLAEVHSAQKKLAEWASTPPPFK